MVMEHGPFAVIVTDERMPGMDGIQVLAKVREVMPDTVRVMLTGKYDIDTAIEPVNQGEIFRFLTKPCDTETFIKALEDGIKQYHRNIALPRVHGRVI
jgi:DNA-binding NtrC family response regulator